ncbi:MAG: FAD-dependent oxidoreductase [Acidimicrobiia bacterium]|nr:FAD-dependent oxidoreductase [Acidimicrobiia bacterium]
MAVPDRARVVIVGGGITGASVLYHLANEGWTDTLLVEKAELTSGSTWHAAGQVTHSVSSYTLATFRKYACELYASLEAETGVATTWHRSGSFRVAYEPVEVDWLRGQLGLADYVGNEMHWVDKAFIAEKHPFYDVDQIVGAVYTPNDGHVDPSGATNALIAGARAKGAQVSRRNRVLDIRRRPAAGGGGFDVVTEQGTVEAEHVVNAAGCYAHRVAEMVGLSVPMANALHTYLITTPVPEFAALDHELPVVRDDYLSGYVRQEQESGLIGIYEQVNAEAAWFGPDHPDGPDWSLENPLFPADYERIGFWLERAFERVPLLAEHGIKQVIRGAIAHTPDGEPMLGPSGVPNFWQLVGVQVGIADGPGLGRELARWMVHGETNVSVRGYDARRFGFVPADDAVRYGRVKGTEDYEFRHQTPIPGLEHPAERPYRRTPLVERFRDNGAVFTQVYGWERPKWYPTVAGLPQEDVVAFRHTDWFEPVREEVRAVRERVGILDSTAFAKFELVGRDAAVVLDQLTTNTLPAVGRIGLTYLLTPTGRIEGEMTVTRLPSDDGSDHFYLVSAAVGEQKDREYFETHWPNDDDGRPLDAELRVVSGDYGVITLAGPRSRELLGRCTSPAVDLSNDGFRWLTAQVIYVAGVETRALRVGFVGELGWELHVRTDDLGVVYDALWEAGQDLGVANVGNHALDSLRMEKGYRISRDLTHDVGPDEAGLDVFVKTDHPAKGDFVGRAALLVRRAAASSGERPYRWRLAYLAVDTDAADVHGSDAVYGVNGDGTPTGRPIGLVTTGAFGYTVDQGLAFAYLAPEHCEPGTELSVRVVGDHRPARVLDQAIHDPSSSRLRT